MLHTWRSMRRWQLICLTFNEINKWYLSHQGGSHYDIEDLCLELSVLTSGGNNFFIMQNKSCDSKSTLPGKYMFSHD